jgi:hypothetical protein
MRDTVRGVVWQTFPELGYAIVVVDGEESYVYPQDGALPEQGYEITLYRNGGDLVPVGVSSQRTVGTLRGAIEAASFVGTSETIVDVWDDDWTWTPLAGSTVIQPTEGVDDPLIRLKRSVSTGRPQATITVPVSVDRRYVAVELSAPAASSTGRDCYVKLEWLSNTGVVIGGPYTYHLDNLYADPRAIQSEPLFPPTFTAQMKITVYSESTTLTTAQFLDFRCRVWTVPIVQGGALLDLEGTVLADHRGLLIGGYPVNEPDRTIPLVAGTGVPAGVTAPTNANLINFPTFNAADSTLRWKPITGTRVNIKLTVACTGAAPASNQMWFRVPFIARDHELFHASYHNSGIAWHIGQARIDKGTNEIYLTQKDDTANNGNVDEATPFAFGNNDGIFVSGAYEIAT